MYLYEKILEWVQCRLSSFQNRVTGCGCLGFLVWQPLWQPLLNVRGTKHTPSSSWCKHPITATTSKNKTLGFPRAKSFSPRPPWHYFPVRFRQRPTQFQLNFNNNFFRTTPSISFTKQPCLPASTIVPGRPIQPIFRPHLRPLPPIHLLRIDRRSFWPLSV